MNNRKYTFWNSSKIQQKIIETGKIDTHTQYMTAELPGLVQALQ